MILDDARTPLAGHQPVAPAQPRPDLLAPGETVTNHRGQVVPAIPLASTGLRHRCACGQKFWTFDGYRGHYTLVHILALEAM